MQASKPKGKIAELPRKNDAPERRECEVEMTLVGEKGSQGWGLGIRRVLQRKEQGGGWAVERVVG